MSSSFYVFVVPLIAFVLYALYTTPSVLQPTLWTDPFELPSLTGTLSPNSDLKSFVKHGENDITAPESMAMDSENGNVYCSLNDGRVVVLSSKGDYVQDIYFSGAYFINGDYKLGDSTRLDNSSHKLVYCKGEARSHRLAWNVDGEKYCGRPLGLRLKKVILFTYSFYL